MRNLVFISHANPEDNEFAQWLGLQLVREGYAIWSDVTKLIGGESFWADIEEAIRKYSIKFLFVLSKSSNTKEGTLDELHLAKTVEKADGLHDFIIPLRVDDLPFAKINVAIHRLNVIDFTSGWAHGLARVLKKLEKDGVPKDTRRFNASTVSSWWKTHCDGLGILRNEHEQYLSNWFRIQDLPRTIYIHSLDPRQRSLTRDEHKLPFPAFPIRREVVSFASPDDLGLDVVSTVPLDTWDCVQRMMPDLPISPREGRNALAYILRTAWLSYVESAGLPLHQMANGRRCAYFTPDILESKLLSFDIPGCLSGRRALVGQIRGKAWHFGISADVRFEPVLAYVVRSHVLFSDDGKNIWLSSSRLHSARRAACKDWWNQHWRDRLLASMYWLAQREGRFEIVMPVSSNTNICVPIAPVTFDSPISYDDSFVTVAPFVDEDQPEDDMELDSEENGEV